MNALYNAYKTDSSAEEQGVWMPVAPGVEFKVRRLNAKPCRDVNEREEKRFVHYTRAGQEIPQEDREAILMTVLSEAVVTDWTGVTDPDFTPADEEDQAPALPCTKDNVRRILTDLPDLRMSVIQFAAERSNYKAALDKEAEGNS